MESELGLKGEEGDTSPPDSKKTQKQCLIKKSHTIKTSYLNSHDSGRCKETILNIVLCVLCTISVGFSAYFSYREMELESRVQALELGLAQKFSKVDSILPSGNNEVLIERLRRDVEQRFNNKLNRVLSSGRKLLMASLADDGTILDGNNEPHPRRPRDIADCVCRPGKIFFFLCFVYPKSV